MNNIEMQTITALAHLRAAILYLLDLSEACGFSIEDQISLFKNIKPLFANKPLFVVVNKADLATLDSLPQEKVDLVNSVLEDGAVCTPFSLPLSIHVHHLHGFFVFVFLDLLDDCCVVLTLQFENQILTCEDVLCCTSGGDLVHEHPDWAKCHGGAKYCL